MTTSPPILATPDVLHYTVDLTFDWAADFIHTSLSGLRVVFNAATDAALNPDLTPEMALAVHYLCRGAMLAAGDRGLEAQLSELAMHFADLAYPDAQVSL